MNKKGSHIGFMLSFAIFITFIVFLFAIFSPRVNLRQNKELILKQLETTLLTEFDSTLANIVAMAGRYNGEDYDELKTELGLPDNTEFAFSFVDEDEGESILAEKNLPGGINIYTKEVLVVYGDNKKAGYLTIKIW
jgi:hypothetical protein